MSKSSNRGKGIGISIPISQIYFLAPAPRSTKQDKERYAKALVAKYWPKKV